MGMFERIIKEQVYIDFGTEIRYGSDEVSLTCPERFPTVGFQLMDTALLSQIADRIRKDAGFRPMHPVDGYADGDCDKNGWYEFWIGINTYMESKCDSCVCCIVVNSDEADNGSVYTIDLSEEEQTAMYNRLDEQCLQYLGLSCNELLEVAAESYGLLTNRRIFRMKHLESLLTGRL